MLIRKTLKLSDVELKMSGEAGQFAGYASVFDIVDDQGDTIRKGAYKASLKAGMPKMFFNHEWRMPVGKWLHAKEDEKGLYVEGEITLASSLGADVYAALKHGTLDGLSVGGLVRRGDYTETDAGRSIKTFTRLMEISPCAFPSNGDARIDLDTVKGGDDLLEAIADIESIRELERFLRDAGGLSKGAATALVARAKTVMGVEGDPEPVSVEAKQLEELHQRLAGIGQLIRV